jgi:5-(carboxyamino)imidazole ribonucleotide synthase
MLAQAAVRLEVDCVFVALEDETTDCVRGLGPVVRWSPGDDVDSLFLALGKPNVVTIERESVDTGLLRALHALCTVLPDAASVRVGQNRALERSLLDALAIPCAPHRVADSVEGVRAAVDALGLPLVVKATEAGYDGKLQWRLHSPDDVETFCRQQRAGEYLLEQWVDFEREVSVVAVRGGDGEFRAYPLTENLHRDGILLASIAPARAASAHLQALAECHARAIMERLNYTGVMAVEFFVVAGDLWVNELAPRVHNSGHWTMNATATGQFENHVRAVMGLPLGDTGQARPAGMVNMLGSSTAIGAGFMPAVELHWHDYNKVPAAGRKMGHVNILAAGHSELLTALNRLHQAIYGVANARLAADDDNMDLRSAGSL